MSDFIRREDAIAVLCFSQETGQMVCGDLRKLLEEIKAIPSAEPERKKGKWVKDEHTYSGPNTYNYVCSACGAIGGSWLRDLPKNLMYPFCPFCGADMRGE